VRARRRTLGGQDRRHAVGADQFELFERRWLLVAISGPVYEGLKRGQLLQRAGCGALIGVQVYELPRVGRPEDRVSKSGRL